MQQEYLMTLEALYANAAEKLGCMSDGSYDHFLAKAKAAARNHNIKTPRLVIDIKFKAGIASESGSTEQPYPIASQEWDEFRSDAATMAEYIPNVYLVDGDKFIVPI